MYKVIESVHVLIFLYKLCSAENIEFCCFPRFSKLRVGRRKLACLEYGTHIIQGPVSMGFTYDYTRAGQNENTPLTLFLQISQVIENVCKVFSA